MSPTYDSLRHGLRRSIDDVDALEEQHRNVQRVLARTRFALTETEAALEECRAGTPPVIPPDPPVIVPPDPPAGLRPGEDLDWHVRPKPVAFDWVVRANVAVSRKGLETVDLALKGLGDCYRASREAGHITGPVTFGVYGDAGGARIGGLYNSLNSPAHEDLTWPGEASASATFVGLTGTASVGIVMSASTGRATPTGDVQCFDIGVRGGPDSFVVRANEGSDHVQFDGCWWLMQHGRTNEYTSGLHIDGWDTLVIRNHQWRGETPGSPGMRFREHPVAYLKAGKTSTLIEGCDMYGGNRTGFQKRPQIGHQDLATDRLMVRGNRCDNYADNWEHGDGGAVYTVWLSNGGTYIYDNEARNFRFKALAISGQATDRNFDFLASGNQHDRVYVSGNSFIPGPQTERGTVSISATDYVRLYDDNHFLGAVTLNSQTNNTYNGLRNVAQEIWTTGGAPTWDLRTYDPALGAERRLTPAEVDAMLVRYAA